MAAGGTRAVDEAEIGLLIKEIEVSRPVREVDGKEVDQLMKYKEGQQEGPWL